MRDAVHWLAELTARPALGGICCSIRLGDTALALPEAAAPPPEELDALMLQEAADSQHAAGTCYMSAVALSRGGALRDGPLAGSRCGERQTW
jgi:5-(hydroxymethyl)furfural/furfural oxidase